MEVPTSFTEAPLASQMMEIIRERRCNKAQESESECDSRFGCGGGNFLNFDARPFHRPNSVAVTDLDCNPLLIDVKKFSFALLLPFYFLPKFLPKMSGMVSYFME